MWSGDALPIPSVQPDKTNPHDISIAGCWNVADQQGSLLTTNHSRVRLTPSDSLGCINFVTELATDAA